MAKTTSSPPRTKGSKSSSLAKRSFWSRVRSWVPSINILGKKEGRNSALRNKSAGSLALRGIGEKRSLAQWKELRRRTTAEVKAHLAEEQPVPAIKKLTRALLDDPQHHAYHELLKKAVEQRRQRRIKAGRKDPWAELPEDLKQEALQLEAFSAYVDELEQLFDKAGIPPLSAPPPPEQRKAAKDKAVQDKAAKAKGAKAKA